MNRPTLRLGKLIATIALGVPQSHLNKSDLNKNCVDYNQMLNMMRKLFTEV